MATLTQSGADAPIKELRLIRVFDAPRAVVFKAWIDPVQIQKWWGPKSFTNPRCEFDPRVGGALHIDMQAPDGTLYPMSGNVLELDEPSKLVFTAIAHFNDNAEAQLEVLNTVTFTEQDGKTTVKLYAKVTKATESVASSIAGMGEGWSGSLDKLRTFIEPSTDGREISNTRVYNAPRDIVYDAFMDPEHLKKWWGPIGFSVTTYNFDARPGGEWRMCMHGPDGRDYQNRIIYIDVERSYRLALKHVPVEGTEEVIHQMTITFEREAERKTRINWQILFPSADEKTRVEQQHHAVEGQIQTMGRLAEYVERE